MQILTIILSALLGLLFLFGGVAKLRRQEPITGTLATLGVGASLQRTIGILEVLGGLGVGLGILVQPLGIAAAIGLAALVAGAVIFHIRAGDSVKIWAAPVVLFVVAGVVAALQVVTL